MLAGQHDRSDAPGAAMLVFHRHLGFAVRAKLRHDPQYTHMRQHACQAVGKHNGEGQKLRRFIAGIAVHNTLIARAGVLGSLDSPCDVETLLMGDDFDLIVAAAISGSLYGLADDGGDVRELHCRDLAGRGDLTCGGHDLAGHTSGGIVLQAGVHHGVRNGIAEFVRVAFGDRLGSQNIVIFHFRVSPSWDDFCEARAV